MNRSVTERAICGKELAVEPYDNSLRFTYPVRPGSPRWAALPNRAARLAACEIAPELLQRMNTENLLDAVLEHPYLCDFFAFDHAQKGLACLTEDIAAVRALLNRADAESVIQNRLEEMGRDAGSNSLLPEILRAFLGEGRAAVENAVLAYVRDPAGSKIEMIVRGEQLSQAQKTDIENDIRAHYPNVSILAPATTNYNCHSYAWYHAREEGNPFWLNDPDTYWKDGSYSPVKNPSEGDIVYYGTKGFEHSGVVAKKSGSTLRVQSKWGMECLLLHDMEDCPYYRNGGKDIIYYRCNYKKGHVHVFNSWSTDVVGLQVRHRRGNKEELEDTRDSIAVRQYALENDVLTFYYENGITAPFDYWWIAFEDSAGNRYTVKNNFFCNITGKDDGNATLTIDGAEQVLRVSFSKSSSDTTKIMPAK